MSQFLKNRSLNQVNLLGVIFATISISIFTAITIYSEYISFKEEIQKLEIEYINSQKEALIKEVNRAIKFIEYKDKKYRDTKSKEEIKEEIVDAIEKMRNEKDGTGYIFIYSFDGVNIADPILKQNSGKNLINFKDPNGKLVIKELIDVAKSKGGFVKYLWNKPIENRLAEKISYAKAYKPFEFMVGSGVYLDNIEKVLEKKKSEYKKKINSFIFQIIFFALVVLFIIVMLSRYISSIISNEFTLFIEFFKNASNSYQYIDRDRLHFREFQALAKFANQMVSEIEQKSLALEKLNQNLESRVKLKTKKLELKKSKIESLLQEQDEFIKNSIHEINTPLSIILTNIDLLSLKGEKSRYLSKIEAGAKIIHNIYNDLSYIVKQNRVDYRVSKLNFSQFLSQRVEFFNEIAIGNMLKFDLNIEDYSIEILFNEVELQRLIDNNISNAIKYSFEDTKIKILLQKIENRVIFAIENIGKEISNPDRVFEQFYREDSARGGFGLGLNIVYQICKKYNIKVEVTSKNSRNSFKFIFERNLIYESSFS